MTLFSGLMIQPKGDYLGYVIDESLYDNRILNNVDVLNLQVSNQDDPKTRRRIYLVKASEHVIPRLQKNLKSDWYMHFWRGRKVTVVYNDQTFVIDYDDRRTWKAAIEYGLQKGITLAELDFPIS